MPTVARLTRSYLCVLEYLMSARVQHVLALVMIVFILPGAAQSQDNWVSCEVGAYVISLYDFEMARDSFGADLWFWSTCDEDLRPLDVMDFPNAKSVTLSLPATSFRNNKYWSYVKVSGEFRHNWDISNFPFDRHTLTIDVEHTAAPASKFRYTPDIEGSRMGSDVELDAWRAKNFSIDEYVYVYDTAFGDPAFEGSKTSDYDRMTIAIEVERKSVIGFFKLTTGVYVSFALAMLSFFLWNEVGARSGLLVGTLFAVLVNQRVTESVLGRVEAFTLVDKIHVTAMVFIFGAAVVTILNRYFHQHGYERLAHRLDIWGVTISLVLYIAVNAWIIFNAARTG